MQEPSFNSAPDQGASYGAIIRDISANTKELIQSEMDVFKDEMSTVLPRVAKHSTQAVIFGALCAISVFPFLAFLVIGLGTLMNENYWMSSLIVSIVCAVIGAPLAIRAFNKLKTEDIHFNRTKEGITRGMNVVQEKVQEIVNSAKGDSHGRQYH